jgi:transglutaminase-like putative cysteine protease
VIALKIHHKTVYRFRQPVGLWAHRLILRPRESRDLRLMSHTLDIRPDPVLTWAHDVFGNAVAVATFATTTDTLVIDSAADILLNARTLAGIRHRCLGYFVPVPLFRRRVDRPRRTDDRAISGSGGRLRIWARGFICSNPTDTLSLLKDLSLGVAERISYQSREVEGTQSPTQTLDRGWGSCRDFAVLFAEAARTLGFGARIVSGYLYNPSQSSVGSSGSGSTHAWAEVYIPGAGWITFDPTNRGVGGFNLIPVAVGRDIRQIMPVVGSFVGMSDAFQGMSVEVQVSS